MAPGEQITPAKFVSFTATWHTSPYKAISPSRPELSAEGRSVVVTGGGTGIGKAIAKAFAQAGASWKAIVGLREEKLKEALSEIAGVNDEHQPRLLYRVVDLANRDDVDRAFDSIVEEQKQRIDILVCNAGDIVPPRPVLEYNEEEFLPAFKYNVRIPWNSIRAFAPHSSRNATVLNISSGIAHMHPIPGLSAHGVSKAAGAKLVDYIQVEHPEWHMVNVQPGTVTTEMSQKVGTAGKDDVNLSGQFCVWLASPEATFLKGKFVWANWDVEELTSKASEIEASHKLSIILNGVPM